MSNAAAITNRPLRVTLSGARTLPAFVLLLVVVKVSAPTPRASTVGRLTPAEEAAALAAWRFKSGCNATANSK
jgi:hypothetical protein